MLIFFDDILVYSEDMEQHLKHLREVFLVMKENMLFAKNVHSDDQGGVSWSFH